MPYTHVSCGTGHAFRDTRTLPYAYGGSECPGRRAPAWRKNATRSCVLDRAGKERMRKFDGGRRPTERRSVINSNQVEVRNCATEHDRQSRRDEQIEQERLWANIQNWGSYPVSFLRKNDLSLEFWGGDCHLARGEKRTPLVRNRLKSFEVSFFRLRRRWILHRLPEFRPGMITVGGVSIMEVSLG